MSGAWLVLAAAAALSECDEQALHGAASAQQCYRRLAAELTDDGVRAQALWHAGDVAGANAAFRLGAAERPDDAALRAQWGWLYLDVHQDADAQGLFDEALTLDPQQTDALLGLAQLALGHFEPGVGRYVKRVLDIDPDNARAHLLLARVQLEGGAVDEARAALEGLLKAGTLRGVTLLDGYALLSAADALDDVTPSPWTERALAVNPRFGAIHAVPADYLVINRRYREAVARYREAVAVQGDAWNAQTELGINLLRVNRPEEARRHLELAFAGDPYNALTVNSLRLLDLLDSSFAAVEAPGLLMRAPTAQSAALLPHVAALTGRAATDMSGRYGYRLADRVIIELYEHHDDFAVRTAGLPGLGILGATFGDVVVMDGPAAKGIEDGFDWLSALWHELAHVYTLGATGNRVSRWFSEGVSVMEEWNHGPAPQRGVPLHFLEAYRDDRLLPVAELDQGFLRPRYPEQVAISYVQAGLLCQLVEERFDRGLSGMLTAYAAAADTPAAVRQGLGIEPTRLDALFADYLDQRFGTVAAVLEEFRAAADQAREALTREDWPAAVAAGTRAATLYPQYVQDGSPYLAVARGAQALGDRALLETTLTDYVHRGGRDPWAIGLLADRYQASGDMAAELDLRRTLAGLEPLEPARQRELGDRLASAGRNDEALDVYQRLLALQPHDLAGAYLRQAQVLHRLGRTEAASRAVLQALEIAPRYGEALDLLLILNEDSPDHE